MTWLCSKSIFYKNYSLKEIFLTFPSLLDEKEEVLLCFIEEENWTWEDEDICLLVVTEELVEDELDIWVNPSIFDMPDVVCPKETGAGGAGDLLARPVPRALVELQTRKKSSSNLNG